MIVLPRSLQACKPCLDLQHMFPNCVLPLVCTVVPQHVPLKLAQSWHYFLVCEDPGCVRAWAMGPSACHPSLGLKLP